MVDYTKMRKGSNTRHGKIIVCPKCGKKGAYKPNSFERRGEWIPLHNVVHSGELYDPMFVVKEYCWLNEAPQDTPPPQSA